MLITDNDAREFLQWLDEQDRHPLTDWEINFVADNMNRRHFTEAQKKVVQDLLNKYPYA